MTRVGYLGPEGTFSGEALSTSPLVAAGVFGTVEPVALPTIHDTVVAVSEGAVERAIVPIENSLEGSVDVTLDALAVDAPDVEIVAEAILPVHHCLIARDQLAEDAITRIVSHPQVIGQCARFIRSLGSVEVVTASSTAEAVRLVAGAPELGLAALGNRLAATLYGCRVLREGVEDHPDNETRFVWLAPAGSGPALVGGDRWKTSLVFWGRGAQEPGWLVACLSELAQRGVNLTRIESRPRGHGLGRYMFFADLEGRTSDPALDEAVAGLRAHCDEARVLGSYPAAPA
jgi:prephenate dehydratase